MSRYAQPVEMAAPSSTGSVWSTLTLTSAPAIEDPQDAPAVSGIHPGRLRATAEPAGCLLGSSTIAARHHHPSGIAVEQAAGEDPAHLAVATNQHDLAVLGRHPGHACALPIASPSAAAVDSGSEGLMAIPEPSSKPAGTERRGRTCTCHRKYSVRSSPTGALWTT